MPKNCGCLDPDLKKAVLQELTGQPALAEAIKASPNGGPGGVGKGGKRAPSAYNIFSGECMREKGVKGFGQAAPAMKACAADWRAKKGGA